MRVLFMGTPDFAVDTLKVLIDSDHELVGVVTQKDKPQGRKKTPVASPVKLRALQAGIPVFQPENVSDAEFVLQMHNLKPDAAVVAAFGQILSQEILSIPRYGCFNVHASLLPKLRGAAPVQRAILEGETVSGVTIMQMDVGLDTGDILCQKSVPIDAKETGKSLFEKLAPLGGPMILNVLASAQAGNLTPVKQKEEEHTYAKMLKKEEGRLQFTEPAVVLERKVRGLNPWPSAYCVWDKKRLKIWESFVLPGDACPKDTDDALPGTVVTLEKNGIGVKTADGILVLTRVQSEGKKPMDAAAFLRGNPIAVGTVLE